jgi:hypothetical protein
MTYLKNVLLAHFVLIESTKTGIGRGDPAEEHLLEATHSYLLPPSHRQDKGECLGGDHGKGKEKGYRDQGAEHQRGNQL